MIEPLLQDVIEERDALRISVDRLTNECDRLKKHRNAWKALAEQRAFIIDAFNDEVARLKATIIDLEAALRERNTNRGQP